MSPLVLDIESTTHAKGNPFHYKNQLVCIGWGNTVGWANPLNRTIKDRIIAAIDSTEEIVGFNLKFDFHWLEKAGITNWKNKRIWDCQIAQFIIRNQEERFPSLASSCEYWGISGKTDIVKTEYWDKGIDTLDIPEDILREYCLNDLLITEQLYKTQLYHLTQKSQQLRLVRLHNKDLLSLQEMEYNGLKFNFLEAKARSEQITEELSRIDSDLYSRFGNYPFNFNSGDHLSALLYGGTITFHEKIPYEHTYKSGTKSGETAIRYKHSEKEVVFPRIFEPLPKSNLKKEGLFATDEPTLKQLKGNKDLVSLLLERARIGKLKDTYYDGMARIASDMGWKDAHLHGQFNQCIVVTGRLSSSRPNLQNIPSEVYELIESSY